ncbi:hypothetical protein EMCRGX_G018956 [Ephydatia muelleri]
MTNATPNHQMFWSLTGLLESHLTITSPLNPSILSEVGVTAGSAALVAECRKHDLNDPKYSELGWICTPLAVETYGCWGAEARETLAVETYGCWGAEARETLSRFATRLAIPMRCTKSQATASIYGRLNLTLSSRLDFRHSIPYNTYSFLDSPRVLKRSRRRKCVTKLFHWFYDEDKEVPLYNEIFQYLKHGEYRLDASKSEKRAIRRRAHSFVMKEGLLYLKSNTANMREKQWIVNKEDEVKVILSCHDGKLGLGQRNVSGVELYRGTPDVFTHGVECCTNTTITLCVGMYTDLTLAASVNLATSNGYNYALSVAATYGSNITGGVQFQLLTPTNVDPPVFQLTCTSTSSPPTDVLWTTNGSPVSNTSSQIVTDQPTSTYNNTLTVTGRAYGMYTCTVTTTCSLVCGGFTLNPRSTTSSLTVQGK